jgi:Gas vesicle synthesis protein GvpL/GvpF
MGTSTETDQATGQYVYGIVPGNAKAPRGKRTVGDGHTATLVRCGRIAALTSPVPVGALIGTPDDLIAHQRMLDAVAPRAAVLPMRFGAVLATSSEVEQGLLAPHHDEFAAALEKFAGTVQFVVAGRYAQAAVLGEVLNENAEAATLAAAIRGKDELATRDLRIRLGEVVNAAIAAKRDADTAAFTAAVERYCEAIAAREPSHEEDAVHLALLVRRDQENDVWREVQDASERWRDRVDFRLLGPMAPYDFVIATEAG